ncbi:GntR family transcriptional regulator [Komagataeibacter sp. FNDCF1]|uniref:GntR family transcriptional regulator n=1 Tax=Komagataeibacter sp. FNDCF1 TaxID=2878681 RepID=UPI001E35ACE0|nr:GntR family transcriptional regulator [Komagataeibacter sp. FNDCF1]MCE2563468.1 GntR family transcriptional regulator [Komagataeibacter sp. FNDCF1]
MRQPADSYREPAFLRVANAMRDDILTGRLASGASLIEAELTAAHGVSRNTLREAMHLLRQQGLVSHEPNRSVRVRKLTRADIHDIFVVRRVVETGALRNRTTVSAIHLDGLHAVIRDMEEAVQGGAWPQVARHSLRFHQAIVSLHDSPFFDQMFALLVTRLRLIFATGNEQAFHEPWVKREIRIYHLITDGQYEAAADHLLAYLLDAEVLLTTLIQG